MKAIKFEGNLDYNQKLNLKISNCDLITTN